MDNKKMKKCTTCGAEVAKSAKICPACGAKQKSKKLLVIAIVAVVAIIVAAVSGTGGKTDLKSSYAVGEVAELNGLSATLIGVTENNGSEFNTPAEGKVYVLCEFEFENNSDSDIAISSAMSFEASCDGYATSLNFGALVEKGDKEQLDGTVGVGKKFRGVIGYEVPKDWKKLEIKFTPDVWSDTKITFVAENT